VGDGETEALGVIPPGKAAGAGEFAGLDTELIEGTAAAAEGVSAAGVTTVVPPLDAQEVTIKINRIIVAKDSFLKNNADFFISSS
jgi:hypothetical protein